MQVHLSRNYISVVVVKNERSGLKTFLIFFTYFYFSFQFISFYSIFRTRVRVRVTRSCCHTAGHKSHDTWKDDVIQGVKHMLTLRYTYGCLG